ncbi:DUF5672 family protein [Formosa haliotis]|uniref:DUF5672 family protein n=1 Tax=Formosa haliotis TaxID=1555194 RepID=UPI00082541AD|nr:DUF5672 family protein [Formosa haliotis]
MKICVVIPVYKSAITKNEAIALKQCLRVLNTFDTYFCEPESIDTTTIRKEAAQIKVEKFNNDFFKGILGYNKLMLSSEFYNRFKNYDYILIHQLDAYVFKNELKAWCNKDYDYIGSPWLSSKPNILKNIKHNLMSEKKKEREQIFFKVGNGGLSIRKVSSFIDIIENHQDVIQEHLNLPTDDFRLMEDVFWSLKAPFLNKMFRIPDYKEAVYFSIDRRPKIGFTLTNNTLPFGCHGFTKKHVVDFWKTKINGIDELNA